MTDEQKLRADFEAYCGRIGLYFRRTSDGERYVNKPTQDAWITWQAALSHASATTGPSRDRASKCPGGMECSTCGCIFIGDESHGECGVCAANRREDIATAEECSVVGDDFAAWLEHEMPAGTVIGDPKWWGKRIAGRVHITHPPRAAEDARDAERYRWLRENIGATFQFPRRSGRSEQLDQAIDQAIAVKRGEK